MSINQQSISRMIKFKDLIIRQVCQFSYKLRLGEKFNLRWLSRVIINNLPIEHELDKEA